MKATLHLITNLIILSLCLHGCASTQTKSTYNLKNISGERRDSLLLHYDTISKQYLVHSNFYNLSVFEKNYINSLIHKNDIVGFRKVAVIFNETPFYFVSPGRTLIFSSGFLKNHLHNEQLLRVFLVENILRIRNNFFARKVIYPNGAITPYDLTKIMNLSLKTKDKLNNLCIEEMLEKKQNPLSLLSYVQQRNKDAFLLVNVINGSVYGLEEERHLKTYLLEKHKDLFLADVELETSSDKFYRLKKVIFGKIKND